MLERGEHLSIGERKRIALVAFDRGNAQLADQIGVFTERLLDAAPARIAATSTTGASTMLTPRARISRPTMLSTCRIRPGSQVLASAIACGKCVVSFVA